MTKLTSLSLLIFFNLHDKTLFLFEKIILFQ